MNTLSPSQVIKHLATAAQSQIAPSAPHESTYLKGGLTALRIPIHLHDPHVSGTRAVIWVAVNPRNGGQS